MALTATFAADLDQFTKSLHNGIVQLQAFDRAGKNASRDLRRELESISGQRAFAEITRTAEAVKRLGGEGGVASGLLKLTDAELRRVSASAETAADKFRRMGVEPPEAVKRLHEELTKLPKPAEESANKFGLLTGGVGQAIKGMIPFATAAGAVTIALKGITSTLQNGSQLAAVSQGFTALAGGAANATATLEAMRAGTHGLVADLDIMQASNKAMLLGLGLNSQQMGDLAKTAQVLGRAMGQDATKSLDDLITALGRSSPLILDNLGLTVKVGEANEQFARSLGKSASELTESERKQAFMNAAMTAANTRVKELGETTLTLADRYGQLKTAIANASAEFGAFINKSETLNRLMQGLVDTMQGRGAIDFKTLTKDQREFFNEAVRNGENMIVIMDRLRRMVQGRGPAVDIKLPTPEPETAKALTDYTQALRAAREEVSELSDAQRVQLNAALQLGGDAAKEFAERIGLSEAALSLYQGAAKNSTKSVEEFAAAVNKLSGSTALKDAAEAMRQLQAVGGAGNVLPSQMKALAAAFTAAAEAAMVMGDLRLADQYREQARQLHPVVQFQQRWNVTIGEFVTLNPSYTDAIREQTSLHEKQVDAIHLGIIAITRYLNLWDRYKSAVSEDRPQTRGDIIRQTLGEDLQAVINDIPMTIARAFEGGGDIGGALASIASQIGAKFGKALGAATGIPFMDKIGEAVGALAGPLVSKIASIFSKPAYKDIMKRVGREWGVSISEGLAEEIAEVAKTTFGGNRQAAEIFSLDKIIGEAGGLNAQNLGRFTAKLHDVFSMMEMGLFTSAQGAQVLNQNWQAFVEAGTDRSGRLNDALREIVQLGKAAGDEFRAITEYLQGQASSAFEGFNAIVLGLTDPWIKVGEDIKTAQEALDKFHSETEKFDADILKGGISAEDIDAIAERAAELAQLTGQHEEALQRQAAEAIRARDALADMGIVALATYGAAIEAGLSHVQALEQALPGLTSLQKAYDSLGLTVEDASLSALLLQGSLLEKNPQLIAGIGGLSQSFIALHNMGLLNVDTFGALQRTGLTMFTRLQSEVAAFGGTHRDALVPMQQYLREAAAQALLLGIPLDENTQLLIEQSRELGLWKDKGKNANEILTTAIEGLTGAVETLTEFFATVLPREATNAADTIAREFRNRAVPALRETEAAVRDVIEEKSPRGLQGVATYAGYAADAIVQMAQRAAPALNAMSSMASSIAATFERFGSTSVVRGLQSALSGLRGIARNDLQDALDFGLAKFQGSGGLDGKLLSLTRDVNLLGLKDLPKELRQLAFQMQDEILGLGPNPDLYRQQWERARDILQSSLRFQLEDLEFARKDAIAALGQLPADYEREYQKALAKINTTVGKTRSDADRQLEDTRRNLTTKRQKDIVDVARVAKNLGITQAEALRVIDEDYARDLGEATRKHKELLESAQERADEERDRLGMTPGEYRDAYQAAVSAVTEQYEQLKRRAEERAQFEIDQLGMLPDRYREQYDQILQLVGEKYSLMSQLAAESAGSAIDSWQRVVEAYREMFRYIPGMAGSGLPQGAAGGGAATAAYGLAEAIGQARDFASQHGATLSDSQITRLQELFSASGHAFNREGVQRFLEEALAQYRAGTLHLSTGGLVRGTTDTVPAMLTPGEAVLNTRAVSRLARGDWPSSGVDIEALRAELVGLRADAARRDRALPEMFRQAALEARTFAPRR